MLNRLVPVQQGTAVDQHADRRKTESVEIDDVGQRFSPIEDLDENKRRPAEDEEDREQRELPEQTEIPTLASVQPREFAQGHGDDPSRAADTEIGDDVHRRDQNDGNDVAGGEVHVHDRGVLIHEADLGFAVKVNVFLGGEEQTDAREEHGQRPADEQIDLHRWNTGQLPIERIDNAEESHQGHRGVGKHQTVATQDEQKATRPTETWTKAVVREEINAQANREETRQSEEDANERQIDQQEILTGSAVFQLEETDHQQPVENDRQQTNDRFQDVLADRTEKR